MSVYMSLDKYLLTQTIVNTLKEHKLTSTITPQEVHLILGTCATESDFGKYREQTNNGPAKGIFQIEPFTGCDIIDRVLKNKYKNVYNWVLSQIPNYKPNDKISLGKALIFNDALSIVLCRTKYLTDKNSIPTDLHGIAMTWKRVYNTHLGKGKIEHFIKKYDKYLKNFNDTQDYIVSLLS